MKILLVNTFYTPDILGGAEISVQKLAEGLVKKGLDVVVICTGKDEIVEHINGVKIYRIKINNLYNPIDHRKTSKIRKTLYRILDIYNIFNYKKIKSILKNEKPDIVNTNNLYGLSPIVWKVSKDLNIKLIHTLRDYYLMCPKVNLLRKDKTICEKCKKICSIYKYMNKKISNYVDFVTAPSNFTIDLFKKNGFFNNVPSMCIYNAIDIDYDNIKSNYISKFNLDKKSLDIVYLGTLDIHKGIDILLAAFNKIDRKNLRLNIAGKGKMEYLVNEYLKKDNRMKYYGFIEDNQKEEILMNADILVIPSMWYEPFGRVIIEAYKYGIPVIGSRLGGIPEIIDHLETGIIVENMSERNLMNALNYFINDNDKINHMMPYIQEKLFIFDIEIQIERFIKLYEDVKNNRHR